MVLDGLPRRAASRLDGGTKNGVGRECASRGHPAPACVPSTWRTVKQPKWMARISQFAVSSVPLCPVSSAECWACVTTAPCALLVSAPYHPCIVTFFSGNRLRARTTRALYTPPSHSAATHSNPHSNSVFAPSAARPGLDTLPLLRYATPRFPYPVLFLNFPPSIALRFGELPGPSYTLLFPKQHAPLTSQATNGRASSPTPHLPATNLDALTCDARHSISGLQPARGST
jgi:hypothetical protein